MRTILARSALVLSTTPPFPREYGNRNRVFQTLQFLRNQGFAISLLLYPFDEEWTSTIPSYYRELVEQFEYFAVIPNTQDSSSCCRGVSPQSGRVVGPFDRRAAGVAL